MGKICTPSTLRHAECFSASPSSSSASIGVCCGMLCAATLCSSTLSMSIGSWGRWKPRWTTQTSTPIVRLSGGPGGLGFSSSPSCCCASLCCRTWCLAPSCSSQCVRGTASRILHHRIRACRRYHAMVHARFRYAPRDRTTLRGQTPKPMPALGAGPRST